MDTFSEVLTRVKSKGEKIHILQYQKEIRDRVKHFRSMELDILERMTKDKEEKEARAATKEALSSKTASIETILGLDKGKSPMTVTERNSYGLGYHNRQLDSRNQSFPICNIN